ncbi:hypothetical protein HPB52_023723 [Rhipicephalus sanguineus]|uniref:Gag-like protein n=1 Tax=Rhipicephalus sanguineus TaxID=34632 RepID=A0A9D4Q4E6_RHISA|nr:hypothetical protein HPB52_023723 [Rhipicephalus sanguineus]
MATRRQTHAVSRSATPSPVPATTPADSDEFSLEGDDVLGRLQSLADDADPARAATSRNDPGDPGEEEDAASSVSDATAVVPGLPADAGSRAQRRAREIQDDLLRYMSEPSNKIPVSARNYIMSRVFELVNSYADLRAEASLERGAAVALRGQLIETRREMAELQRANPGPSSGSGPVSGRAAAGPCCSGMQGAPSTMPPGVRSYAAALTGAHSGALPAHGAKTVDNDAAAPPAPVARQEHQHVAFLTPTSPTTTPAQDVLRLLKTNIDPASNGIADVTLRHTRYGLTVFTNTSDTVHNMVRAIQENSVTRASIAVRVPGKRKPHVRFSGVDPDVSQDRFFTLLNERNAGLQVDETQCAVKMVFRERSGTNAFVAEVDPESFDKLITRQRVTLGWTAVRVTEDLHVPTCTFCATYGHGRNSCPHRTDPTKATCMKCGGNHLAIACSVRMGDPAVCCAECRRAGRTAEGHPAGFPACPILTERVARIRARTDYGPRQ